jgi:hypothetical protein
MTCVEIIHQRCMPHEQSRHAVAPSQHVSLQHDERPAAKAMLIKNFTNSLMNCFAVSDNSRGKTDLDAAVATNIANRGMRQVTRVCSRPFFRALDCTFVGVAAAIGPFRVFRLFRELLTGVGEETASASASALFMHDVQVSP